MLQLERISKLGQRSLDAMISKLFVLEMLSNSIEFITDFQRGTMRILTVACLGVLLAASSVRAQPLPMSFESIESKFMMADSVLLGRITNVAEVVTIKPGGREEPNGVSEVTLTLKVQDLFKGEEKTGLQVRTKCYGDYAESYRGLAASKTLCIWYLGPTPNAENKDRIQYDNSGFCTRGRQWSYWPLFDSNASKKTRPTFTNDLSVLNSKEEFIKRLKDYGPVHAMDENRKSKRVHKIRIPSGIGGGISSARDNKLTLAIDHDLEATAQRMITTPRSFFEKESSPTDLSIYLLRLAGVDLLRHYRSQANQQLLKKQFEIPLQSTELSQPRVRSKAYEVLLSWNVKLPIPKFADEINSFDLGEFELTETIVSELVKLKNLELINIRTELLTDEVFKLLERFNLIHLIAQASTDAGNGRPKSAAEVCHLSVHGAPLSDRAIQALQKMKNLRSIDLQKTDVSDSVLKIISGFEKLEVLYLENNRITDQGLSQLSGMKSLVKLCVCSPKITKEGVASLKTALPHCEIISSIANSWGQPQTD